MTSKGRSKSSVAAPAPTRRTKRGGPGAPAVLDPIITMNAGGIIQSASDSVEQVFGWTPGELLGQNVKMLIPEPRRSDLDRYLDRYRNATRAKVLQRTGRFDAVRKDGKTIQIEMSMSRADLPVNAPPYFVGIVRDVTNSVDRGNDDDERQRLQNLITEQTRALATANLRLQLSDRLSSLGTLAAGLGHDMNTVLLPIRAHLNAIEHEGISSASVGHLTAVRRSIAYLQHLSDGLHYLVLEPDAKDGLAGGGAPTSLSTWWSQVGDLLKRAVPKRVSVEASIPGNLRLVNVAPHWRTQAVLTLIVNAGGAMPASRRRPMVRVSATPSEDGRTVLLTVSDNGRGMSLATQRRAMDLFFTTKPRSLGTGLGLPLARKVALRAGGDIELHSEVGRGTSVVLRLPAASRAASGDDDAPRAGARASISIRDHRTAALVSHTLSGIGVEIAAARRGSGSEGDLLITDIVPGALTRARAWRKKHPEGALLVVGVLGSRGLAQWAGLGARVIRPQSDFVTMHHVLTRAIAQLSQAGRSGKKASSP